MAGIYIHIPFCKSRCIYCGFYSTTLLDRQDDYVDAVIREMQMRDGYLGSEPVRTIYLGGGTPSMLKPSCLERLCHAVTAYAERRNERTFFDQVEENQKQAPDNKTTKQPDNKTTRQPDNKTTKQQNNQTTQQQNNQTTKQQNNQTTKQPNNQTTKQQNNQTTKQPNNQTTKQHLINNIQEFTLECNPDDITDDYARLIASLGVNRVSMGAQTFSDDRLAFLHRRHKSGDVRKAVEALRRNGIENISIDLMFGFPGETVEDWQKDIDEALRLGVQHLSAYSLMYEGGTTLFRLLKEGRIKEVSDETSLRMYETLIDSLQAKGYEHYEISNFALPGYRSRHNSSYWKQVPYLGLGASAHSYDISSRQWNISSVKDYIASINASSDEYIEETEHLTDTERYDDLITTALRTSDGIDISVLSPHYRDYIIKASAQHIALGNLSLEGTTLRLTRQGLFISDAVMVDLIYG